MLKTIRSAAKKNKKLLLFLKHLPWHSRLFLGSKCGSLEFLLLIVSMVFKHRSWRLMLNRVQHVV